MDYKVMKLPSTPISIPPSTTTPTTITLFTPSTLPSSSPSPPLSSSPSPPLSSSPCTPPPRQISPDSENVDNECGPPTPPVILTPCAACKFLRRRCMEKCVLAPYFPPTDPYKFTIAHRVFGASNIIKFLQELPESLREDAVSSMVYEASARIRDPVYGCTGAICQLQKQVMDLQEQLARSQAGIVNLQCQQANMAELVGMLQLGEPSSAYSCQVDTGSIFEDGSSPRSDDLPESMWQM